ncbi:MipA/OmpV family protein [Pseudoalteromonas sp. Cnat2-41]|uniref:MipA/OmpV family protein n=1 Tax=unclassified Pseudoalteromonas TaxID=194690 RepID=UPI001EF9AB11|nr:MULTISPECIES: MipA/OmpV family protein [unclassified Pseudoalteromonas]MCF2862217.1 MipA/OmpV family protein [Pseudoalteromonas sp. CNAT2-18]MCG7558014.1 MipA/OmpV family protein [Pseudoalteromonas sp. CNAT2-18.1]MCG7566338.1 MipA/OmpV family protein [Pseudoalteromonas sp. CnMc7-15]
MKKVLNAAWFLLVAVQAQAEQSTQWQVTLGAGGAIITTPWAGMATQHQSLPFVSAQYGRWRFGVDQGLVSYRVLDSQVDIDMGLNFRDPSYDSVLLYKSDLSDDPVFTSYDDPNGELVATMALNYHGFSARFAQDISNESSSLAANVSYTLSPWELSDKLRVHTRFGVRLLSEDYTQHFYGVSKVQAAPQYGRTEYHSQGAINPFARVALSYQFAPQWQAVAAYRSEFWDDEIYHSPLVSTHYTHQLMVFFTYRLR